MTRENTANVSHLFKLTDDEAVTLRRVAFGQSDLRSLRRADLERLSRLRLIEELKGEMCLTVSGKEHFDSLPKAVFATTPNQRNFAPLPSPPLRPRDRADRLWQMTSGARSKDR